MKSNPQQYAELFSKRENSQRKNKNSTPKKVNEDGKDTVKYILNEHSENLEQLKEVQTPSCIKCHGKTYATAQTQVSEIDMQMKYISSTATQCTLISKGNESMDQVETSDVCTMYE